MSRRPGGSSRQRDRVIDISVAVGAGSIDYPGDTLYHRRVVAALDAGASYNLSSLELSAHTGTHLDAPAHFLAEGATVDAFDPGCFVLPALVYEVAPGLEIAADVFRALSLEPNTALLLKSDNSRHGRSDAGRFTEQYSCLTEEAARLLAGRRPPLLGVDYISVDRVDATDFPVHHILLGAGVWILEGIDLADVARGPYELHCAPLKLANAEASPVRAFLVDRRIDRRRGE